MNRVRDEYISPLIDKHMPNASLEEKRRAQFQLWRFFDALYAVFERMEREGRFPLTDENFR
jgi:hypothetical protein